MSNETKIVMAGFEQLVEAFRKVMREELQRIQKDNDELVDQKTACSILKVSRPTLLGMRQRGEITTIQVGRSVKFRRSDLERFIK